MKYLVVCIGALLVGCSGVKVTGAMCDTINTPKEQPAKSCPIYVKKEADKAYEKGTKQEKVQGDDTLEVDTQKAQ